jgi:hypothetical protein
MVVDRNKLVTDPPGVVQNAPEPAVARPGNGRGWISRGHLQNWIDCIKSRDKPNADAEVGHRSATICHLCNITRELGRRLRWDPEREVFPDDKEANALLDRPRRKGWELPDLT